MPGVAHLWDRGSPAERIWTRSFDKTRLILPHLSTLLTGTGGAVVIKNSGRRLRPSSPVPASPFARSLGPVGVRTVTIHQGLMAAAEEARWKSFVLIWVDGPVLSPAPSRKS